MGIQEEQLALLEDPEEVLRTKWNSRYRPLCAISTITVLSLLVNAALAMTLFITISKNYRSCDSSLQLVFCKCPQSKFSPDGRHS